MRWWSNQRRTHALARMRTKRCSITAAAQVVGRVRGAVRDCARAVVCTSAGNSLCEFSSSEKHAESRGGSCSFVDCASLEGTFIVTFFSSVSVLVLLVLFFLLDTKCQGAKSSENVVLMSRYVPAHTIG